jgi:hypothetical protein
MPQGTRNSATFWAKVVKETFQHLEHLALIVYQDDILNHDTDLLSHLLLQQVTYDTIRTRNMKLKLAKTHQNYRTMRVLGHILTPEGRIVDPNLVKTILDLQPPRDLKQVQSVLGLIQVAREYIPGLANIIAPIQALARKGVDIPGVWKI